MIDHLMKQDLLLDTVYCLLSTALTTFGLVFALFLWRNSGRRYPRKAKYRVFSLNKRKLLPQADPSGKSTLSLSVIIPAYKEESRIGLMLIDTLTYLEARSKRDPGFTSEVIVVDDGSPDETSVQVRRIFDQMKPERVQVGLIRFSVNQGKGAAISEGILAARGEHILFADADGATRIKEIEKMEEMRLAKGIDGLFCGSRCLQDDRCTVERHPLRKFLMIIFKQFVGLWGVKSVKDTQCGFKMMSRKAAKAIIPNLRLNRWIFDVELIYLAECLEIPILEVPVSWMEVDGSKLCLATDSVRMATDLVLMRLAYALRFWTIHTFKGKLPG